MNKLEKIGNKSRPKIGVIGAGVIGMTSAVQIMRHFRDVQVTLIADKFSPLTTSDVAAGLWIDYLAGKTPQEKLKKWLKTTYDVFEETFFNHDAAISGVNQMQGYQLHGESQPNYFWRDIVRGFGYLDEDELKLFGNQYRCGVRLTSYTAECSKLLPYLMKTFLTNGGTIIRQKLNRLHDLIGQFDIVINCTGLAAKDFTPDPSVIPIRGQIIKVRAPWIKTFIMDEDTGNYIIPNLNEVILGGTAQQGDYNLKVESEDANQIWQACNQILPSLKDAEIVKHWVGLRPSRFSVRLERETIKEPNSQRKMEVIHNYGHGGSGISLSWGCSIDVIDHLTEYFKTGNNVSSKL